MPQDMPKRQSPRKSSPSRRKSVREASKVATRELPNAPPLVLQRTDASRASGCAPFLATIGETTGLPVRADPDVTVELIAQLREGEPVRMKVGGMVIQANPLPPSNEPYDPAAHPRDYVSITFARGPGKKRRFHAMRVTVEETYGPPSPADVEGFGEAREAFLRIIAREAIRKCAEKAAEAAAAGSGAGPEPVLEPIPRRPAERCFTCGTRFTRMRAKFCSECGAKREWGGPNDARAAASGGH